LHNIADEFEQALLDREKIFYHLKLFVSANSPRSNKAILNIKYICNTYLEDRYKLEVVDVLKEKWSLKTYQVIAIPTLVRESPLPQRKFVGDLSNEEQVLSGLGLK